MSKGDATPHQSGHRGSRKDVSERGGAPRPLAAQIAKLTRQALGRRGFAEASIVTEWESIVGSERAADCRPDRLSFPRGERTGGTLRLRVAGPAATALQHDAPLLIERINRYFGYPAIARLKLVHAPLGDGVQQKSARRAAQRSPDPGDVARLRESLTAVEDPELRASLEGLGRAILAEKATPKR